MMAGQSQAVSACSGSVENTANLEIFNFGTICTLFQACISSKAHHTGHFTGAGEPTLRPVYFSE
jgi:hypothetical protein